MTWIILMVLVAPIIIFQWVLFKDLVGCCKVKRVEKHHRKDESQLGYDRGITKNLRAVK